MDQKLKQPQRNVGAVFWLPALLVLASHRFDEPDEDHSAKQGHQETVDVEAVNFAAADQAHYPAAQDRANDADDNVEDEALLRVGFHYHRGDPADQSTKNYPENYSHKFYFLIITKLLIFFVQLGRGFRRGN